MAGRSAMIRATRACGVLVALGVSLSAGAQGRREANPPYTPAEGAKDLKATLFNWTWYMGMLRGVDEHELVTTLEYQGTGVMQVDGQPCTLSKYRSSINYQYSGERIQYACVLPDGSTASNIEVVHWQYAWNEDVPGAEIIPGEGTATPMPDAVEARLIRLWASPQGAPKAALAGASQPDPNRLPDDGALKVGDTSVAWESGKAAVTFPIPGVPGATAVATLDDRYMAERVVVTHGSTTTEFTYDEYDDWNNPLNKIEAYYAGRITERRNGQVVRDLTTLETETGSVYVVMPVPDSVRAAITPMVAGDPPPPVPGREPAVFSEEARNQPTPRLPNGKPDLTGNWNPGGGMNWRYGFRRCGPSQLEGCSNQWNQTIDFEFEAPSRFGPNRPLYRPEHWDKVQQLDMWTNKEDPVSTCQPLGIPRQGAPRRIYHTVDDITFLYSAGVDGGGGYTDHRVIPTDGREHDPREARTYRYTGYTVGHWEGDTLVLDSISFTPATWLARGGFFHSDEMHVIERFTRRGNEMLYEVTVEDPEVLAEPWEMTPRLMTLNTRPDAGLIAERGNCEAYELNDIVTQIRH